MSGTNEQGSGVPAEYQPSESLSLESDASPSVDGAPQQPDGEAAPPEADAAEPTETLEERHKREKRSYDQRIGYLTKQRHQERARAEEAARKASDLEQRLRRYEQPADGGGSRDAPPGPADLERMIDERADVLARARTFLQAGAAEFPDWDERRQALLDMGADAAFSQLLVELPDGARVTGHLAQDPEAAERILSQSSERARALALGRYAASLDAKRAAASSPRRQSNLAPPIAPPAAPRGRGEPDPSGGSMEDYMRWSQRVDWRNR